MQSTSNLGMYSVNSLMDLDRSVHVLGPKLDQIDGMSSHVASEEVICIHACYICYISAINCWELDKWYA